MVIVISLFEKSRILLTKVYFIVIRVCFLFRILNKRTWLTVKSQDNGIHPLRVREIFGHKGVDILFL